MVVLVKIMEKKFDTKGVNNAILSGLVAVTAGAPLIEPEGAFVVGVVAAAVYYTSANLLLKLQIDDVVDAVGFLVVRTSVRPYVRTWGGEVTVCRSVRFVVNNCVGPPARLRL